MASLTSTGIRFSDNSVLNSKRGIFPTSTAWIFYQSAAPTGWTKSTTHDDKALRVVSGSGGGFAGTNPLALTMSTFQIGGPITTGNATGGTALSVPQIASHTHGNNGNIGLAANAAVFNPDGVQTGWAGGDVARAGGWTRTSPGYANNGSNDAHSHPVSGSGTVPNQPVVIKVQYIDVIICTFNG